MKYAIIRLVAIVSLLGMSATVQAQMADQKYGGLSYTFLDAAYQGVKFQSSPEDITGNGGRLEGSIAVSPNIYVLGSYEYVKLDDLVGPPAASLDDLKNWSAGLGFNSRVSKARMSRDYRGLLDRYSVFMDGQYVSFDDGNLDGFAFNAGFRAINFTSVEFITSLGYEKIQGLDNEFRVEGRLLWRVWKQLQLQIGADVGQDSARWWLGVRVNAPNFSVFK
jgi:hypothetical protein